MPDPEDKALVGHAHPADADKELAKFKPFLMVVRQACLMVADAIAKMFGLRTRE